MKILDNTVEPVKEKEVPEFPCYYRALSGTLDEGLVVLFFEERSGLVVEPSKSWFDNKEGVFRSTWGSCYFRSTWGSCYNGLWSRMPKGYGKSFIQE